jgi:hypothetical protein
LYPAVYRRAEGAVVFMAAVAASTAALVAEVAGLAETVSTPHDLMAVISAARRLAGADSRPASGMDSGPA